VKEDQHEPVQISRVRLNGKVQRIATTVVALVGEPARARLDALGQAANVATVRPAATAPSLERAIAAWQAATRTHTPYLLHDADPLATVADAWVRRFNVEQLGPAGELEAACGCQLFGSCHATWAYSWISPPSRSRRATLPAGTTTADSPGPSPLVRIVWCARGTTS
jgi:hypothetical protein